MTKSLLSSINECIKNIESYYKDIERTLCNLRDLFRYPNYRFKVRNFPKYFK